MLKFVLQSSFDLIKPLDRKVIVSTIETWMVRSCKYLFGKRKSRPVKLMEPHLKPFLYDKSRYLLSK